MPDNNLIEQDHRGVKQRIAVMLGFKRFRNAAITIAGIELMHCIARDSSDCDVWGFKAELCLQSGTRCSGPELCTAQQRDFARVGNLHHSRWICVEQFQLLD